MRTAWKLAALMIPLVCGSCVTERVVDGDNEANRLIEEESSPALRQ